MRRRAFLQVIGGSAVAAALPACASLVATPVTPVGGEIRLPVRLHAALEQPGGFLRLRPAGGAGLLYVLAHDGGRFVVVSPVCTHLQCTVAIEGMQLVCPCHGSTYDREGNVLRGPAERPLRRYPAAVTPDGILVIRYEEAA